MSRLILVLGMHRSGTSLIARSLQCLGVNLGERAEWTGPDNPSGFWEDQDILAIDDAVLARYGARWDTVSLDLSRPVVISDLSAMARRVLADKLDRYPIFGIKDPRMCRLLPFWKPVFKHLQCEVAIVRVWRSTQEVVRSLVQRNHISPKDAFELVSAHELAVEEDYDETWPEAVISYHSMVSHPAHEVRYMAHKLSLPVDEERLSQFEREFVRRA